MIFMHRFRLAPFYNIVARRNAFTPTHEPCVEHDAQWLSVLLQKFKTWLASVDFSQFVTRKPYVKLNILIRAFKQVWQHHFKLNLNEDIPLFGDPSFYTLASHFVRVLRQDGYHVKQSMVNGASFYYVTKK